MPFQFELKNYRCFTDEHPARFDIGDGFVSFVGLNNSGKSSLLKFFYEFRDVFRKLGSADGPSLWSGGGSGFELQGVSDPLEVFSTLNNRRLQLSFEFEAPEGALDGPFRVKIDVTVERERDSSVARTFRSKMYINGNPYDGTWRGGTFNAKVLQDEISTLAETFYIGPYRNVLSLTPDQQYFDIEVGRAFVEKWRELKTGSDRGGNRLAQRLEREISGIFNFESLEINAAADNSTLRLVVNGEPFSLGELGTGIAHFIIVLTHAATLDRSIVLIDEPELSLHPALQVDFLTTLGAYAPAGVVFATHSLGLARSSSERIYGCVLHDKSSRVMALESVPSLAEFAGSLAFSSTPDLGFSRILLVEGTTEIKVFQQLLRLYGKEHEVLPLSLGGSGLIHAGVDAELRELLRITNNVSAVVDSERSIEGTDLAPERAGFVKACQAVGIDCHVLERRFIESYFTDRAIRAVTRDRFGAIGPYDSHPTGWVKGNNWRIARELSKAELDQTDLGAFLSSL